MRARIGGGSARKERTINAVRWLAKNSNASRKRISGALVGRLNVIDGCQKEDKHGRTTRRTAKSTLEMCGSRTVYRHIP